jgi:hypothetical protein
MSLNPDKGGQNCGGKCIGDGGGNEGRIQLERKESKAKERTAMEETVAMIMEAYKTLVSFRKKDRPKV